MRSQLLDLGNVEFREIGTEIRGGLWKQFQIVSGFHFQKGMESGWVADSW